MTLAAGCTGATGGAGRAALIRLYQKDRADGGQLELDVNAESQIAVTMDVYSQVTSDSTLRALKALGERH